MSSATEYVLLASALYLRQEDGSRKRYRSGDVVSGLSDEQASRLLTAKAIAVPGREQPAADDDPDAGDKPEPDANKPALVAWLLANVVKDDGSEYSEAALNRLSKPKLWELINSVPEEPNEGESGEGSQE
ncbi:MAG: hypothetical protein ACPGVG_10395 [Mycobacterium sp.]